MIPEFDYDSIVWKCSVCGWIIASVVRNAITIDPDCPNCSCQLYSEFVPMTWRKPAEVEG